MSNFWKKMSEKELKDVKGAGSPCESHGQEVIVGLLAFAYPTHIDATGAQGSCQPAYEYANPSSSSSVSSPSSGAGCTSR
jgi:hypothetical protein